MAKWDIDRALRTLETESLGVSITRVRVPVGLVNPKDIKVTEAEKAAGEVELRCLNLNPKFFFLGRTIRQAYLVTRRELRKLDPEILDSLGIRKPRKKPKPLPRRKRKKSG